MSSNSSRRGPPKHQNRYAWKPKAGQKINEREVGGKLRPYPEITGVCPRCKDQIDWKRRYGKYKPLSEPAKCQRCTKRAVRQAYHNLCPGCAKEQNVCAKCCSRVDRVIGRDLAEVEAEQKMLEAALKNARERDRRILLRAMDKGKSENSAKNPANKNKVGELFPSASLEEYAAKSRGDKDNNNGDNMDKINDEDDGVDSETGVSDLDDDDDDYVEDAEQVCNW
ncbi:hypothetical protein CICLE_v10012686mg [Citrus x clementina]|uniref:Uncharacterized protein n=1 Tax=Citrus clementina TaxID=85681 RepID=V4T4T1_CITCL|nr:RING finger protein PSH1 isoform X2 [Citrus x clementina]ESR44561.1 hypothetical protein CICLE_v10012686mg [Citrus x clementina]